MRPFVFFTTACSTLLFAFNVFGLDEEEPEVQELRERLTEREDETRVEDPFVIEILERPLSILGQYEAGILTLDRVAIGDTTNRAGQTLLEQEIELEAFYPFSETLSFFAQFKLIHEEDLDSDTPEDVSDLYLERGEAWLYAEELFDLPLELEIGRLEFEDDRLWWWDEDLDAVRLILDLEEFEIATALARELAPSRSDRSYIDPENNQVMRWITEVSLDWSENHSIQVFVLSQDDQSRKEKPGDIIRLNREDESDADLVWYGARATGAVDLEDRGIVGYWIDTAWVEGDESIASLAEEGDEEEGEEEEEGPDLPPGRGVIDETVTRDVRGYAFDAGFTWLAPFECEPRFTAAYAMGSGDERPDSGTDRSFHQTGLQGNEPGYGGVQRFQGYGEWLDPELSNLSILTVGLGCTILENSSIDLVFHDYQLVEKADSLRDAQVDAELTGRDRDLGQGVDLIVALEEWERVEFEFSASAFRAGRAFGRDKDEWFYGAFAAGRLAF